MKIIRNTIAAIAFASIASFNLMAEDSKKDIVDTAVGNGNFSIILYFVFVRYIMPMIFFIGVSSLVLTAFTAFTGT